MQKHKKDHIKSGEWVATGAGATGLTNHHDRTPGQRYAIDFARVGEDGRFFTGEGETSRHSDTWGAEVFSPVVGRAVSCPGKGEHLQNIVTDHPVFNEGFTIFIQSPEADP